MVGEGAVEATDLPAGKTSCKVNMVCVHINQGPCAVWSNEVNNVPETAAAAVTRSRSPGLSEALTGLGLGARGFLASPSVCSAVPLRFFAAASCLRCTAFTLPGLAVPASLQRRVMRI